MPNISIEVAKSRLKAVYGDSTKQLEEIEALKLEGIAKQTSYELLKIIPKEIKQENKKNIIINYDIDKRFKDENLLSNVCKELDNTHYSDNSIKILLFLCSCSSLIEPKNRVSMKVIGNSSSGKTNLINTVLSHIPSEVVLEATRITKSEFEDNAPNFSLFHIGELNYKREDGSNSDILESIKQLSEDGMSIFKKDMETKEGKEIKADKSVVIYSTTDNRSDEEEDTRFLRVTLKGDVAKNKFVIKKYLQSEVFGNDYKKPDWIQNSLRGLDKNIKIIVPFAEELSETFKDSNGKEVYLFDPNKDRSKRDIKRIIALSKVCAWLHQETREIHTINDEKVIFVEPVDLACVLELAAEHLQLSNSGIDGRENDVLEFTRENIGQYDEEVKKIEGFSEGGWIPREIVQKDLKISSRNTIKNYCSNLSNLGLIEQKVVKGGSRVLIRPVKAPVSDRFLPISTPLLTGQLMGKIDKKNKENTSKTTKTTKYSFINLCFLEENT